MQQVRFTIKELKSNLKFLFLFSLISAATTTILQVALMRFENESVKIQRNLEGTEAFISQYRNVIFYLHMNPADIADKQNLIRDLRETEKSLISQSFDLPEHINVKTPKYQSHLFHIHDLRDERLLLTPKHNHKECYEIAEMMQLDIESYRKQASDLLDKLQQKVDIINLIIVALLVINTFVLIYAVLYAQFSEK